MAHFIPASILLSRNTHRSFLTLAEGELSSRINRQNCPFHPTKKNSSVISNAMSFNSTAFPIEQPPSCPIGERKHKVAQSSHCPLLMLTFHSVTGVSPLFSTYTSSPLALIILDAQTPY